MKNNEKNDKIPVKKSDASQKSETIEKIKKVKKKKIKKNITTGIAFVQATFNNTIVSITDDSGNVIASSSLSK